jgi:hypothetical protein
MKSGEIIKKHLKIQTSGREQVKRALPGEGSAFMQGRSHPALCIRGKEWEGAKTCHHETGKGSPFSLRQMSSSAVKPVSSEAWESKFR